MMKVDYGLSLIFFIRQYLNAVTTLQKVCILSKVPRCVSISCISSLHSHFSSSSVLPEHCRGRGRFLWWSGLRGQHEGSGDQVGPDGDDCLRPHFLHCRACVLCNLPGELRRGRPHHDLLRRPQPQSSRSFCEDGEGEVICPRYFKKTKQVWFSSQSW